MRLRFIGDGERDAVTVPPLVRTLLHADFTAETRPWPRLHGRPYDRKLQYELMAARTDRADAVVATVDRDRTERGQRLARLKKARDADRSRYPCLPAALGEADPHCEVWLLDDPVAVRQALRLAPDAEISNVRDCGYAKTTLEQLLAASPRCAERPLAVWPDIAARVDATRCNHKKETGFAAFADEVRTELGPLFARAS